MRLGKIVLTSLAVVVGLYAAACCGIYAAMCQPPERFGAIMMHVPDAAFMLVPFQPFWMSARAGHLHVGDAAPDFELPTLDHKTTVKLSAEYASKPVVLIFGSYT